MDSTLINERPEVEGDGDITMVQPNSCVKDATYYNEEGDCIILVNTTLFKAIHSLYSFVCFHANGSVRTT
jgi:hypothetical protein